MSVTQVATDPNGGAGARRSRTYIVRTLLLLPLACALLGAPQTQAAARKRLQRASAKATAARAGSVRHRRARSPKANNYFPPPREPRNAEVEEDVGGRLSWFQQKRAYPFDEIPAGARRRAWASRPKPSGARVNTRGVLAQQVWTPIGPAPTVTFAVSWGATSGRVNAVAVSPANPQLVLVGASTGGIWRSTDGGAHFVPVSDEQVDVAVGWISFAPSNPSVVYAGLGDMDYQYLGAGVLKSTDGGQTWARVSNSTLPDGVAARLAVDPTNAERLYLAQYITTDRSTNVSAGSGLFISNDGGVNWTKALAGQSRDVVVHPVNPQTIYATISARTSLGSGDTPAGLYRSTDGGDTWTNIPVPTNGLHSGFWDFRVAVTPADPQRLYAYYGTIFFGETRFQMSADGGATWQQRSLDNVDSGQFGYCTYLHVDPADADTVYLGSRDLYKSTSGGASWKNLTNNFAQSGDNWRYQPGLSTTHADQQAFAFEPGNPSVVYLANDGGVWKSADGGATVQSLNPTLSLVQFNSLAVHPTDAGFTVGGTQDNGTERRLPESATNSPALKWDEPSGSDGGAVVINPVNPAVVYGTYYSALVNRFKVSPTCFCFEKEIGNYSTWGETNINTRIAFYPPFTGNGVDQTLYFGSWRLFKSTNLGDTWASPAPTTDLTKGGRDVLSAIAVSRSDTNVIYTGSAQGRAMTTGDGGSTWRDITAGLPNRSIESIKVDPSNPARAYLSVSGYGSGHVFKTTDAGQTWADVSGNLPNIPTSALLIDPLDPQVLYAGTDVGVFRSTVGGSTWETFNNGMPPVMVTAFTAQPGGRIQVGTYGRGAYELITREVAPSFVAFGAATYTANESAGAAVIAVTRTGDASAPVTVEVRTVDNPAAVPCADTTSTVAYARCDYATTVQTVSFAAGETSKTVNVPLVNDAHAEPNETVQVALSNPTNGATIISPSTTTLAIVSDDATGAANPIFQSDFFVRQQYLDFFGREPDPGGFQAWKGTLDNCPDPFNSNPSSPSANCDRVSVSTKFFRSREFEQKGGYVFDFYKVALSRLPHYSETIPDMASLTAVDDTGFFTKKAAFTDSFVQRQEFKNLYDALTNTQFVNALLDRYSLQQITTPNPSTPDDTANKIALTRADLINRLNGAGGTLTRAQVLRAIADSDQVRAAEANSSFVAMQYFGYLRRDPEEGGYNDWLKTINANPSDIRSMVNGFMNSDEYKLRFGKL